MANKKNKSEEYKNLPEEKVVEKTKQDLDALVDAIKEQYGVQLQPIKNTTYKFVKVADYLKDRYEFRYNRVSLEVEFRRKSDDDRQFNSISKRDKNNFYVEVNKSNYSIGRETLNTLIDSDEVSTPFHPFEEYIFSLPKYDPDIDPDYIAIFLDQVKLCDESERSVFVENFRKWITAAVASLITDGISNQQCFVLVGRQGIFKTTFLNNLVPRHMQMDYLFSSKFNFEQKDHYKYLATKMIVNLDELATFSRTEEGVLKTILSDARVIMRLPYGSEDTKWWRKASFCGSTNNKEFLKDETGNRRFLVFEIDNIKIDKEFNIDDVYRQGLYLFRNGFQYWFDQKDITNIEERNNSFHDVSIEEDLIQEFIKKPTKEELDLGVGYELKTPTALNVFLAGKSNRINVNETTKRRMILILRKLGFTMFQKRMNGSDKPTRVWAVKLINNASFDSEQAFNMDDKPI